MELTIFEWQANLTEDAANMLAYTLEHTEVARLDWKPSADEKSECRSAMEQATECIRVNLAMAAYLRGEEPSPPSDGGLTVKDAQDKIRSSAKEFADVVRGLTAADLEKTYTTRMGDIPGAFMVQLPANNMMYHVGQVNFIQTLYGDAEFRFPKKE